jgi:hypothetical protein
MDAHRIFSRRFFTEEKIKPRSYRTYSQRFRKEKRRFGNYHEVLLYFLLFVVKKKFSYIFLKHQKTVFTTPLTRNTLSTNISTNIPNVGLPLAVLHACFPLITGDLSILNYGVCVFITMGFDSTERESVMFIGTQFSNLYTAVDTPARGRVVGLDGRCAALVTIQNETTADVLCISDEIPLW